MTHVLNAIIFFVFDFLSLVHLPVHSEMPINLLKSCASFLCYKKFQCSTSSVVVKLLNLCVCVYMQMSFHCYDFIFPVCPFISQMFFIFSIIVDLQFCQFCYTAKTFHLNLKQILYKVLWGIFTLKFV